LGAGSLELVVAVASLGGVEVVLGAVVSVLAGGVLVDGAAEPDDEVSDDVLDGALASGVAAGCCVSCWAVGFGIGSVACAAGVAGESEVCADTKPTVPTIAAAEIAAMRVLEAFIWNSLGRC
jgi:hypothetical protein